MLYTGIDLHKRSVVIATVNERGEIVREASVPASRTAVARYFQWLPEPTVATVEATSSWYWLRDLLAQERVPLTLAHAKFVKAIAYAKVKTDAVDALTLAQLHRAELIPRAHMVSPELRPLRDLLRTRLHLVEKRTSAKNSVIIYCMLRDHTPYRDQPAAEYDERHPKRSLQSLRKRAQSLGFDLVQADTGLILEPPRRTPTTP